jgi:hypothetical protein
MKTGTKFDEKKLRFDLVPPAALKEIVRVLSYGAEKYEAWNWLKVDGWRARYTAALGRHLNDYQAGELLDPDTQQDGAAGLMHLAQVATNAMFLIHLELARNTARSADDDLLDSIEGLDCPVPFRVSNPPSNPVLRIRSQPGHDEAFSVGSSVPYKNSTPGASQTPQEAIAKMRSHGINSVSPEAFVVLEDTVRHQVRSELLKEFRQADERAKTARRVSRSKNKKKR